MTAEPLSKQRLRVWLRLLSAQRGMEAWLREKMRLTYDCTLPRFDVLSALDRHRPGLRMSDLSAKLKVSNGNVTGIVDRLAADGQVERVSVDGDRRAMRVRLTPVGIARFAEMAAQHEIWVDQFLATHEEQELKTLVTLLARVGGEHK